MGRKPNALILQYFERGAKLNDSSNRYQHTCKACGEKFPKGRIDSLTTHLVKKCPAISLRDRQKALLALNNLPNISDPARTQNGEVQMNGPTVELPIGTRNWTALETLAEVSRQMVTNEKHDDRPDMNTSTGAGSRTPEPPRNDRLELQEQYTLDNPPVSYDQRIQRDKKNLNQKTNRRESEASLATANFASHMAGSRSTSPNLAMAATSMAAAAAAARFVPSMVDPQLLAEDINSQNNMTDATSMEQELTEANAAMSENFFSAAQEQQTSWQTFDGMYPDPENLEHGLEDTDSPRSGTYRGIAMNSAMTTEFSAEYGNGERSAKPKVRGRFTAARRKEVQGVRKIGACIRCRMLKKPCSGGTPCTTCKGVESARLWKTPCIRTKIAEEFHMYSAGLHTVLAHREVSHLKSQVIFRVSANPLEVSHYPETTVFASFSALEGQEIPVEGNIDPGLSGDFTTNTLRIFDSENDDLPLKLEAYLKRMSSYFYEREPSHFMNVTLDTALQLSIEKQDALLTRVLELWATVHVLVDHELHWIFSERVDIDGPAGNGPIINRQDNFALLCLQLNAAAEKKAAQICKHVLNDLERRLLQRSPGTTFETFLVAIVLLNCVEKSTWLFKSWEQVSFNSRWPLDKKPDWYASQGEKITDMLQMLLRMRSVPPKTYIRAEDGILATDGDQVARQYFQKLELNYLDVLNKQTNSTFEQANTRCYELRYCSKLLLPPS